MTPFLQLALALTIIIIAAKLGGYISYRLGQPSVLGELMVGIILGPSVIDILKISYLTSDHLAEAIHFFAEIGVLLLMFLAGLDLHIDDLRRSGKVAGFAGVIGMLLPLLLGTLSGIVFSMETSQAIFIGLVLSATSVSISAQTLMELKVLRSRVGVGLLGAAVIDDILVLLGLSVFAALFQPSSDGGLVSVLWIILRIILFLVLASLIGILIFPRLSNLINRLPISQGLIAFAIVTLLLYGWTAEVFGHMAAITGAFLAGIWFARTTEREHIHKGISTIAYSMFVPVFFVNIGLSANLRLLNSGSLLLLIVMLVVAVVGKVAGAGYGAYLGGLSRRESLQLGLGMMSRGEVGLIVGAVGIELGLIDQGIFSAVVGVIILTTLITPPALRLAFKQIHETKKPEGPSQGAERRES